MSERSMFPKRAPRVDRSGNNIKSLISIDSNSRNQQRELLQSIAALLPVKNQRAYTKALKKQLKFYSREISDVFSNGLLSDVVILGSPGWRQRYYKYKFSAETDADMEYTKRKVKRQEKIKFWIAKLQQDPKQANKCFRFLLASS